MATSKKPRSGAAGSCTYQAPLAEYCLEIVGDDQKQAREIRNTLKKGIEKAADICRLRPPVCVNNLGLTRDRMPQITGDANVIELRDAIDRDASLGRSDPAPSFGSSDESVWVGSFGCRSARPARDGTLKR